MARAPGLWSTNDAGWGHPLGAVDTDLISWFQVEATAVADDRPLPVQPLLHCAESATARAGVVDLAAIQVLLPVQGLVGVARPPYAPVPAARTTEWFPACDPRTATPVEVTVTGGRDRAVTGSARALADDVARVARPVFDCRGLDVVGPEALRPPPFDDRFWNGPASDGVRMRGHLSEWTTDAIGWLSEVIADVSARLGIRAPALVTVTRA